MLSWMLAKPLSFMSKLILRENLAHPLCEVNRVLILTDYLEVRSSKSLPLRDGHLQPTCQYSLPIL